MKKFIIKIKGYGQDDSIKYVSTSADLYCQVTTNLKDAKMFASKKEAEDALSKYLIPAGADVEYLEIYDLKNVSSADYLLGDLEG